MDILKKILLPLLLVLFLIVIFLDQNSKPIPVKIILGSPVHISLSLIIVISMTVGALIAIAGFLVIKGLTTKNNKELVSEDLKKIEG